MPNAMSTQELRAKILKDLATHPTGRVYETPLAPGLRKFLDLLVADGVVTLTGRGKHWHLKITADGRREAEETP